MLGMCRLKEGIPAAHADWRAPMAGNEIVLEYEGSMPGEMGRATIAWAAISRHGDTKGTLTLSEDNGE